MMYNYWNTMMGEGGWLWFMGLPMIVWTIVGILAIVWLWKKIQK